MIVRLLKDHYEYRDGKLIRHRAGSSPDLPPDVAEYITSSAIKERQRMREKAMTIPGSPEYRAKSHR